jgi:hypothetical protein
LEFYNNDYFKKGGFASLFLLESTTIIADGEHSGAPIDNKELSMEFTGLFIYTVCAEPCKYSLDYR